MTNERGSGCRTARQEAQCRPSRQLHNGHSADQQRPAATVACSLPRVPTPARCVGRAFSKVGSLAGQGRGTLARLVRSRISPSHRLLFIDAERARLDRRQPRLACRLAGRRALMRAHRYVGRARLRHFDEPVHLTHPDAADRQRVRALPTAPSQGRWKPLRHFPTYSFIRARVPEVSGRAGEGALQNLTASEPSRKLNVQHAALVGNDSMFHLSTGIVTIHRHIRNALLPSFDTPGTGGRSIGNAAPTFQERCIDTSGTGGHSRIAEKSTANSQWRRLNLSNLI